MVSIAAALGLFLQVSGASPQIVERARLDPSAEVSFHAMAAPETVYVGDAVMYELAVFISDETRQRLRKNPEFVPPELRSVLAYDLRTRGSQSISRDGRNYEVHVFRRALFPVAPGVINVPPARLTYTIPLGSSFFSKEEARSLKSEAVTFVAIDPPQAGRPANWGGAVGNLRLQANVESKGMRVGDPFVLTLRVTGDANVHLLPRPVVELTWGSVVPSVEHVVIDSMAPRVRGTKEFEYLVTPTKEGRVSLPAIEYPYFDPAGRRYLVARSAAQPLTVGEGTLVASDSTTAGTSRRGSLPLRTTWRRPMPDSPDRTIWYWIVVALVPIPVVVRALQRRPRRMRLSAADAPLRALAASRATDAARVRAALRDALVARLGGRAIPWADPVGLRRAFRHHGITDDTIKDALSLFSRLDNAAYGTSSATLAEAGPTALALYAKIDEEARVIRKSRASVRAGTAAVVLLIAASLAAQEETAMALFNRGVQSYTQGNSAAAATDFFAAAKKEPASSAAWANAGTASWEAADTARAVVGWQRALRLDPLDDGARQLLTLVGADAGAANNVVWPLPRRLGAWVGLALWIVGWYYVWRHRRPIVGRGLLVLAASCMVVSVLHQRRLDDGLVAVIASPTPLRSLPAMGAEAGITPLTGELVHIEEISGVWVRVKSSSVRDGWIDAARVIDLNGRPLRN